MRKKEKLKALQSLEKALDGFNQSKMYEYLLYNVYQVDLMTKEFGRRIFEIDSNCYLGDYFEKRLNDLNELNRQKYFFIDRNLMELLIECIKDNIENEND